jgi:16S rRNA processing protein RimM
LEPGFPEDAVEVGRIVGAWGVKGWIRVQPFSSDPQALFSSKRWFVRPPETAAPRTLPDWPTLLRVVQAREHGDAVVAGVHDITDRNAAEALRGGRVFVSRSSFPTPDTGELDRKSVV